MATNTTLRTLIAILVTAFTAYCQTPDQIPFQQADGAGKLKTKYLPDDAADFSVELIGSGTGFLYSTGLGSVTATNTITQTQDLTLQRNGEAVLRLNSYTSAGADARSFIETYRARGTIAAPSDTQAGDNLGKWAVHNREGGNVSVGAASINFWQESDYVSGSFVPAYMTVMLYNSSGGYIERMRISSLGNVTFVGSGTFGGGGAFGGNISGVQSSAGSVETITLSGDNGTNDGGAAIALTYNGGSQWRIINRNEAPNNFHLSFVPQSNNATVGAVVRFSRDGSIIASGTNSSFSGQVSFNGNIVVDKTITAPGTTTTQTINKNSGRVNIAAASSAATVINNRVTANSIILAIPASNDTTLKSTSVQAFSGSFTINGNAAASAETPVNFLITN